MKEKDIDHCVDSKCQGMIGYYRNLGDIGSMKVSALLGVVRHVLDELVENLCQSLKKGSQKYLSFQV